MLPHLTDGTETNAVATGTWDFTGATLLGLPAQGVTNIGTSITGNGLDTALDVDWGAATTTAMTNVDWASFGGGWTNLAFSGSGNALTGATATATTLTLQRGTIEGGGGGAAQAGVEGDVLTYPFATNIALLASTNLWPQRILEITNDFTLQVPTMADTNAAGIIWLTVPSIGAYTVTIPTSSPPVRGYVPSLSTNSETELFMRWSDGWRMRRLR